MENRLNLWIETVAEDEATGDIAKLYEEARAKNPRGRVPPMIKVLSIRPGVARAKEILRNEVLGDASSLGAKRADMISLVVSGMNDCRFCGTAHAGQMVRRGDSSADQATQLYLDWRKADLDPQDVTMLEFCEKLNFTPSRVTEDDIQVLRDAGFNDENILDIVACTAYRNFVNRIHDGLGMSVDILRGNLGDEFVDSFVRD
jgi:uncharacterized peroxidase-related enzyme